VVQSRVGSGLTHKHSTRLERLAKGKDSILLQTLIKSIITLGHGRCVKGIITILPQTFINYSFKSIITLGQC
jgi:hypothetical protein